MGGRLKKIIDPCRWPLTLKWPSTRPKVEVCLEACIIAVWSKSNILKRYRPTAQKRSLTGVGDIWPWSDLQQDQKLRFAKKLLPSKFGQNRTRESKVMPVFIPLQTNGSKGLLTPVGDLWLWSHLQHDKKLRFPMKLLPSKFGQNKTR